MRPQPLSDTEKRDWLRLARTENVGPITFFRLLERFGSARAALDALPTLARSGGRKSQLRIPALASIDAEMDAATKKGWQLIAAHAPDYPASLRAIEDPPPLIYVAGHANLLHKECLAIVGSRNAALISKQLAQKLAQDLGRAGLTIVSGLARGIDTAAHKGALDTGTIGVVAGGIDVIYPPENADLYAALAARGAIISEMPPGTEPQARHFPRRNRIIAGLARGTLVIEAALQSGSLITARLANEQGRDVFAVPGSPADPRCHGTNNLLREGAILVERAEDVLNAFAHPQGLSEPASTPPFSPPSAAMSEAELAEIRAKLLENIAVTPITVDDLIRECQVSAATVHVLLLELELAGRLERHRGNKVSLSMEQARAGDG